MLTDVGLDDDSFVDFDSVVNLVLVRVVWVKSMCHVSRDQEGFLDRLFEPV
jgi:hypothetical protein